TLQTALWDRLLNLPAPFFRRYAAGELAARMRGVEATRQLLGGSTISILLSAVFALLNLPLLFYYDPRLATFTLALLAIIAGVTLGLGRLIARHERDLSL